MVTMGSLSSQLPEDVHTFPLMLYVICYILCLLSIVRAPRTNRVRVQVQGFFKKIFLVMCIDLAVSKRLVG